MSDTATTNNFGVPVTKAGDYILRLKRELAAANERIAELERRQAAMFITLSEVNDVLTEQGWHSDRGLLFRVKAAVYSAMQKDAHQ